MIADGIRETADSLASIRMELAARLRKRLPEIQEAIFSRVYTVPTGIPTDDPEYVDGLRAAVKGSTEYAIESIERGKEWAEAIPLPAASVEQARRSARSGMSLDTVLRRYVAGDRVLEDFIIAEAEGFSSLAMREALRLQGPQLDRLMAYVAAAYMQELEQTKSSPAQRLAGRVERLLAGDGPVEAGGLDYELDAWHLGAVVSGAGADRAVRSLASRLDRRLLVVPRGTGTVWAWLGGREALDFAVIERAVTSEAGDDVTVSLGELRYGLDGWRLTHHEALAASQVAMRKPQKLTRGSDVVLLAAIVRDEVLAKSLRETYITPLEECGGASLALRATLRAYFATGRNAATAAATLGVDRHTIHRRLRKVEDVLGRLLNDCHAELEVALALAELEDIVVPQGIESLEVDGSQAVTEWPE